MTGQPYSGPLLVATPDESEIIEAMLEAAHEGVVPVIGPEHEVLRQKCRAVRLSDPRFQQPTR